MSNYQHRQYLSGSEAFGLTEPVRQIVVLPYTSNLALEHGIPQARLSRLSVIAVTAATRLWQQYPESRLVIPGETDYVDQPNTTALMKAHAMAHSSPAVPEVAIDGINTLPDGRTLDNTYLQMEAVAGHLGGDTEGTIFSSLRFHRPRVAQVAEANGISDARFVAAEDIHAEVGDPYDYGKYFDLIDSMARAERFKRFVGHFDSKGTIFSRIMRVVGPNIDDIHEHEGVMSLEHGHAWAKQRKVTQQLTAEAPGMLTA